MLKIEVQNLSHTLASGETLFEEVNFSIESGEIIGILGANGSGKSTLLKMILGLEKYQAGKITWSPSQKNVSVAYVPQHTSFNQYLNLTIADILYLAPKPEYEIRKDKKYEKEIIEEFNLAHLLNRLFKDLSLGEKHRTLMAMHSLAKPQIWFLDEPNIGLDSAGQDQLYRSLKKFAAEKKTPIFLVDHNINQSLSLCDQILCLNRSGHYHSKRELLDTQKVQNLYHCKSEHEKIRKDSLNWSKDHENHDYHDNHENHSERQYSNKEES